MSKFNAIKKMAGTDTVNLAGGNAFSESPKLELISALLTSFLDDKYYESSKESIRRIINIINNISDKKFVGKAAIYARTKFGMRSVSHLVAGEIAKNIKGEEWTKNFFDKIVYRPDDMLEIIAYHMKNYGDRPIPNSLKKGFRKAIGKFNSYELGKYKCENKEVSMIDLVNLIHPTPTEKNGFAIGDLINGTLKAKDTWEKDLTEAGQKAKTEEEKVELKKDVWVNLIESRKLGYFALLRNLRNIIQQAPDMIDNAITMLTDEKLIKNSLVLPFRFSTAYKQIKELDNPPRKVIAAISKAADIALSNVPKFDGKTLIVLDVSGSMNGRPIEIGSMFASVLAKTNDDADFMIFANEAKYKTLNPQDSVLTLMGNIMDDEDVGGGTNFHSIFEKIDKKYDRIIILSDMQGWMEDSSFMNPGAPSKVFKAYKNKFNADPYVYSFDLNSYGTLMFPEKKVHAIAGWSEKIFDLMKILETDKEALIHDIEKIQI